MSHPSSLAAHLRATLVLGLPLIGTNLAQMSLHLVDTVMLGWYGVTALAAVVIGASSFFVIFILGSGFAQAVMPMVAQALAAQDDAQVRRDVRMGLWLSVAYGAAAYPLFWNAGPILLALGQRPEVAAAAQDFLRIAGLGLVPALVVTVLKNLTAAVHRAGVALWVTLAAVGLNAAVNWALIFGHWGAPEMGVRGAAVASVSVQVASALALWLYVVWQPDVRRFHLWQRLWRPDWAALRGVFRLGWPIGVTGLAESALFQASALMMGWVGTVELAAHGIAIEVAALAFMLHLGLANAVTVRVAQARGAGDGPGVAQAARAGILLSLAVGAVVVVAFLTLPGPIIGLFLDRTNPEAPTILRFGTLLLAYAALFQIADAMQAIALGLLRGVQDTRVPMVIAAVSYWCVGIPASYGLAFVLGMGGAGLWAGLVAGLSSAALALMWRFWRGRVSAHSENPLTQM